MCNALTGAALSGVEKASAVVRCRWSRESGGVDRGTRRVLTAFRSSSPMPSNLTSHFLLPPCRSPIMYCSKMHAESCICLLSVLNQRLCYWRPHVTLFSCTHMDALGRALGETWLESCRTAWKRLDSLERGMSTLSSVLSLIATCELIPIDAKRRTVLDINLIPIPGNLPDHGMIPGGSLLPACQVTRE